MVVVGEITAPLEIDRAEELIIKLGAAISTRRIYAPGHGRAVRTMAVFQDALRGFPCKENEEHFEFTVANGMLLHRGIPVGMDHGALGQVAFALEARKCRGVRLHREVPTASIQSLVDWLSERLIRPLTNPPKGISLLAEGGADHVAEGEGDGVLGIPDFKLPNDIHRTSARVLERVMEEARSRNQIDFKEIIELTNWVADAAFAQGTQLVSPTQTRCQDHYTFSHSVNVFLIATAILEPFARDRQELASFA
ncbi:MAG: HD-GYP domain-containing protein, partial [Planctomycetota bacterium]